VFAIVTFEDDVINSLRRVSTFKFRSIHFFLLVE
jgi:hypothetical protein